ncbi:unnamed protein product [Aphis gossypii]|uniref:Uncharacterized protein n=1 Tax=Aphis gossypii TaxID=80765 RepID=A0A9P0NBR5_APHGO|nr:unnamed protein product [Aphis gossypii]
MSWSILFGMIPARTAVYWNVSRITTSGCGLCDANSDVPRAIYETLAAASGTRYPTERESAATRWRCYRNPSGSDLFGPRVCGPWTATSTRTICDRGTASVGPIAMGFGRVGTSGGPERSLVGARPRGGSTPARRAGRVT